MKILCRLLAAAGVSIVLGGMVDLSTARASDEKAIAATNCFVHSGGTPSRDSAGRLSNTSFVSSMFVSCPLVRDNPTAKPLVVEVFVIDNSSAVGSSNFSCQLLAMGRSGLPVSAGGTRSTTGTNSSGQALSLPIPPLMFARGAYVLNCTIPRRGVGDPSSGIASIYYSEP
jgi:hypothetical protein